MFIVFSHFKMCLCVASINLMSSGYIDEDSPAYAEVDVEVQLESVFGLSRTILDYKPYVFFHLPMGPSCFERLLTDVRYQQIKAISFYFKMPNIQDALAQFQRAIQAINPENSVIQYITFGLLDGESAEIIPWQNFTFLDGAFNRLSSLDQLHLQGFRLSDISAAMRDRLTMTVDECSDRFYYAFSSIPLHTIPVYPCFSEQRFTRYIL